MKVMSSCECNKVVSAFLCIFAVLQERRFCVSNRIFRLLEVEKKAE